MNLKIIKILKKFSNKNKFKNNFNDLYKNKHQFYLEIIR
jgi:hypothetical protein